MSVLYFGAIGDRFGRRRMLLLGLAITIPASLVSATAGSTGMIMAGRVATGLAAGMSYPTTLALINALWAPGPTRTRAIALWSGISGGAAMIGPTLSGVLLTRFWWGSVFLIAVPFAAVGLVLVWRTVPAHVNESTEPVDHLGGALSVLAIAALVTGITLISSPGKLATALAILGGAAVGLLLFAWRQAKAANPLYDLHVAARRLFWVPAVSGMVALGSLVGAMYVGQQFLQNVLHYSTVEAGFAAVPGVIGMVLAAPRSARLITARGTRVSMLIGYAFLGPAFLVMLLTWKEGAPYWWVGLGYLLVGLGVGFSGPPASRSLTGSVPVTRVGMGSGTADLQRDLGGSIMQAAFGSLLTAGYAVAFGRAIAASPQAASVSSATRSALLQSYEGAAAVAARYPQYQDAIVAAARSSFLDGANWAYTAGLVAMLAGALLVATCFPDHAGEQALAAEYHRIDGEPDTTPAPA